MMILKTNSSLFLKQPQQYTPQLGIISSLRNDHRCRCFFDYFSGERKELRLSLSLSSSSRYYLERSESIAFIGGHSTALKSLSLQIFVLRQFSRKISLQWLVTFASTVEGDIEGIINNVQQNSPEAENKRHFFMETDICSEEKEFFKSENDTKVETTVCQLDNTLDGEILAHKLNIATGGQSGMLDTSSEVDCQTNAVVIVFDIETTGLNPSYDRIIEFAARDLAGGDCSTIQTLVNPEMHVPLNATNIHGIYSDMVNRSDVPRWKEVAPAVLEFVECRGGSGGLVFLVAHNGRKFDVPFLVKEFQRCSIQIPSRWRFVDSMPIAREAMKAKGLKGAPLKLTSLHELYKLPFAGQAHRALADVGMLAYVLKMLMIDLKMPVSALLERSFTANDIKTSTPNNVNVRTAALQHLYSVEGSKKDENRSTPWDNTHTDEVNFGCINSTSLSGEEPTCSLPEKNSLTENRLHKDINMEQSSFPFLDPGGNIKFLGSILEFDALDLSQLSSMLQQHVESKYRRPKLLHLWRFLDFYLAFFEDAEKVSQVFSIGLTAVVGGKDLNGLVPMASLHNSQVNCCIHTLLAMGISVFKQDQVYKIQQKGDLLQEYKNLVLTPGMVARIVRPQGHSNNHLMSIMLPSNDKNTWGLAYADFSTGEFYATEGEGRRSLMEEIFLVQPSEIIYPLDEDNETGSFKMPPGFCYTSRPALEFSLAGSVKTLQEKFGLDVIGSFGFEGLSAATCAAAGLLRFIDEIQGSSCRRLPFHKISVYFSHDYMLLDRLSRSCFEVFSTRKHGGLEGSLLWAIDQTKTNMGKRTLKKWISRPLLDKNSIYARQDAVEIFMDDAELRTQVRCDLAVMNDLQRLASEIACGLCTPWDFLALAQSINIVQRLVSKLDCLNNPHFLALAHGKVLVSLSQKIQSLIHTEACHFLERGHVIKDYVDEILDSFRVESYHLEVYIKEYEKTERTRLRMPSLEVKIDDSGKYYFSISKHDLRNVILPIDYQKYEPGNSELAEFFIPATLSETSKKLGELLQKARLREAEILDSLKEEVHSLLQQIHATGQAVAEIDVLASFAEVAALRGYCKPVVVEDSREITIIQGRHPVAELLLTGTMSYTPNPIYMGYGSGTVEDQPQKWEQRNLVDESNVSFFHNSWPRPDVVILTGPPGSGKSCYLKQVALIQILSQIGSYVPAKKSYLGISDAIYMRMDEGDDLFSGMGNSEINMTEYAEILNNVSCQSLVLLDGIVKEGTNESNSVTRAMVEYLAQTVRARTLLITQQGSLCALEGEYPNISNFHFEDGENSTSLHCVKPGYFLESAFLKSSKLGGLSEWVVHRAVELITLESAGVETFSFDKASRKLDERITSDKESEKLEDVSKEIKKVDALSINTFGKASRMLDERIMTDEESGKKEVLPKETETETEMLVSPWIENVSFGKTSRNMNKRIMPKEEFRKPEVFPKEIGMVESLDVENISFGKITRKVDGRIITDGESGKPELLSEEIEKMDKIVANTRSNIPMVEVEPIPEHLSQDFIQYGHLEDLWQNMLKVLQNNPATYALTKQKGALMSVQIGTVVSHVHVATSALFIKKFRQHEHAAALECAFLSVLHTPIKLKITSTGEEPTNC